MSRVVLAAAALLLAANGLKAQITTYVVPPRAPLPTPQMVAAADSVRRDSVQRVTMTNMKAWVDSAAGVPLPSRADEVDSAAFVNDVGRILPADTARPVVTTFSNGSVAPATASALPKLVVGGVVVLLVGAGLLATRPRA